MTYIKIIYSESGNGSWGGILRILNGIFSVNIDRDFGESIPTCTIQSVYSANIHEGNEIRIYVSETSNPPNSSTDIFFRGTVEKIDRDYKMITISCEDWLARAKHCISTRKFTGSTSIISILELLGMDANLSINTDGLTNLPVTQLTDFDCRNSTVFEKWMYICELIDAWFYYDPKTVRVRFFYKNNATTVTLVTAPDFNNVNVLDIPKWSMDASNVINDGRAKGGSFKETFTETNYAIDYVKNADGLNRQRFLFHGHAGYVANIRGNYSYPENERDYDPECDMIEFSAPTTGEFGIFTPTPYYYLKVIYAVNYDEVTKNKTDSASIAQFGQRTKIIDASSIKSNTGIQDYANRTVEYWKKSTISATMTIDAGKVGYDAMGLIGKGVNIWDYMNNIYYTFNSNWTGIITSTSFSWPGKGTIITISDHSIKNPSYISAIYSMLNDLVNTLNDAGMIDNVKSNGSVPMTGSLDMNGNVVYNFKVQNVTQLE